MLTDDDIVSLKWFQAIQEYTDAKEKFVKERSDLESHLRQQAETHQEQVLELEKQVGSATTPN